MAANNFSPLLGTRGPPTSGASPALSSPHPDCTTQNIATTPRTLSSVYRISPARPRAPYPRPSRRPWRAAVETARATLRQGRPAPLAPPWVTVAATEAPARGKGGQRAERRRPRHGRAQAKALRPTRRPRGTRGDALPRAGCPQLTAPGRACRPGNKGWGGAAVGQGRRCPGPTVRPSGAASRPGGEGGAGGGPPRQGIGPSSKGEPDGHGEGTGTSSSTSGGRQAAGKRDVAPKVLVAARCPATSAATASGCAPAEKSNEASGKGSLACRYSTGRPSSFLAKALALVVGAARLLMSPSALRCLPCCCGWGCGCGLAPLVTFPSAPRPGWVWVWDDSRAIQRYPTTLSVDACAIQVCARK